jgi:hypothetical protein
LPADDINTTFKINVAIALNLHHHRSNMHVFRNTKATKMLPPVILNQILNQKHDSVQVGFQFIIVVIMKNATIWDVIMCSTVEVQGHAARLQAGRSRDFFQLT